MQEKKDLLLSEAIKFFLDCKLGIVSPATIDFYYRRLPSLVKQLGDIPISEVDINSLRKWRNSLFEQTEKYKDHPCRETIVGCLSPYTIHQYIRSVKQFFKWFYAEGLIKRNPSRRLEQVQLPAWKPKGISKSNRDKMFEVCKDNPGIAGIRDYAIMAFIADTGCRISGVAYLKLENLYLETNSAYILEKGRGGLQKSRSVFYTDSTKIALLNWMKVRPVIPGCEQVFTTINRNTGLKTNALEHIFRRVAKQAGIEKNYYPHQWRHGAIRAWLENGMPLPTASQLAGHSSTKITGDIYGIVSDNKLKLEHLKYSWMREGVNHG